MHSNPTFAVYTDMAVVQVRVHPASRRQGVGTRLLREAVRDLRAERFKEVESLVPRRPTIRTDAEEAVPRLARKPLVGLSAHRRRAGGRACHTCTACCP
ncbi:GNAT family N-acetyltransferase [Nonomuraea sp. NPDC051941]|uniref:GNAT family N-acetyltransferase n=1 Tax=Nonomuraea sp. NPDC051941 TaxID=3364373 RepID=UPI0037CB91E8